LRDYDPARPKLDLRGSSSTQSELPRAALETLAEHYSTHPRLSSPADCQREAQLVLEAQQQLGSGVEFETNALDVLPGSAVALLPACADVNSLDGSYAVT